MRYWINIAVNFNKEGKDTIRPAGVCLFNQKVK